MLVNRAYKTEIDPNNIQATILSRCCGASGYIYNWGLAEWKRQHEAGEKPSAYGLKKQFNAQKDEICPWIRELPYFLVASTFDNLGAAFKNFFRRVKNGETKVGYPKFKKRGSSNSFQMRGYKTLQDKVYLGRYIGWVKLKEKGYIPSFVSYRGNGGALYATVSRRAERWYISVCVEEEIDNPRNDSTLVVGVDFGMKTLAVCSDGTVFENPAPLREAQKKLARLQRELSRRNPGGENWRKTKLKIQRCHAKVSDIRKHVLHQISHDLVIGKSPAIIVIENLNVSGLSQNRHMAQAILDCGFYELRRQIEYKAQWNGVDVVIAGRWYPSSKTCSRCGHVCDNLTLSDRTFHCENCGLEIDRDYNAALNLAALGNRETHGDCLGSCEGESRTVNQEPSNRSCDVSLGSHI